MQAIREKLKIRNNKIAIDLPEGLNNKMAEVIILVDIEEKEISNPILATGHQGLFAPSKNKEKAVLPNKRIPGIDLSQMVISDRR
jgi:hypothetical protein